jgi:hypothetical protein
MSINNALGFGGETFDEGRDGERFTLQLGRVRALMLDGKWRTLAEIAEATGYPEASISARLRDLRKPRFGGFQVERRYLRRGLHEYRVVTVAARLWEGDA